MIVAVDGRRLQDRPLTGAGRWVANILPHLADATDLVLLTDARRPPAPGPIRQVALGVPGRLPEMAWLQGPAARWLRANRAIFHGTFNAVPYAAASPSVVTLYDLSYELWPEDFSRAKARLFAAQARWSATHADAVITVSRHARTTIIDHYSVDPASVLVAPSAVDPMFQDPAPVDDLLAAAGRTGGRYVVAVTGAPRRGVEVAVAAWRRVRRAGLEVDLVVVGRGPLPPETGVVSVGRIDDRSWAGVLAGAAVLCYPTRFEGYGMPAIEAAALGVPVVCGRVGPLPEVLGESAEWCDERSPASVGDALLRVLSDPARSRELAARGRERAAAAPTWADSAGVVLEAYRRADR